MKYEDIKTYNERCEKFQGIVTNERLMEVLIDEVEELRGLIEAKSKPLTDQQKLDLVTNWFAEDWAIKKALSLLRDYDIGGKE